jgi:hypothetical protein
VGVRHWYACDACRVNYKEREAFAQLSDARRNIR